MYLFVFAACAVISAWHIGACDRFAYVSGRVSSCDTHRPIASATVRVHGEESPDVIVSNREGAFGAGVAAPQGMLLRVTVSHPDHLTLEVPEWDTSEPRDVCLRSLPPSP